MYCVCAGSEGVQNIFTTGFVHKKNGFVPLSTAFLLEQRPGILKKSRQIPNLPAAVRPNALILCLVLKPMLITDRRGTLGGKIRARILINLNSAKSSILKLIVLKLK